MKLSQIIFRSDCIRKMTTIVCVLCVLSPLYISASVYITDTLSKESATKELHADISPQLSMQGHVIDNIEVLGKSQIAIISCTI